MLPTDLPNCLKLFEKAFCFLAFSRLRSSSIIKL